MTLSYPQNTHKSVANKNDGTHDHRQLQLLIMNKNQFTNDEVQMTKGSKDNNVQSSTFKGSKYRDTNNDFQSSTFKGAKTDNNDRNHDLRSSKFKGERPNNKNKIPSTRSSKIALNGSQSTGKKAKAPSTPNRPIGREEGNCQLCRGQIFLPNENLKLLDRPCSYWQNRDIDSNDCRQVQSTYGSACGCPNSPRPRCNVCPDGDYVWKQNSNHNGFVENYCVRMIHNLSTEGETYCNGAKNRVASMCCMSTCSANKTNRTQAKATTKSNTTKAKTNGVKSAKGLRAEMNQLKNTRAQTKASKMTGTKSFKTNTIFNPMTDSADESFTMHNDNDTHFHLKTTKTTVTKSSKSGKFFSLKAESTDESSTIPNDNDGDVYYYYYDD